MLNTAEDTADILTKAYHFLNLSEYETRRKSNIWDSDIDRGINVIYNGGKSNISSSERVYLTEKAVKDGINWTAGNDERGQTGIFQRNFKRQ